MQSVIAAAGENMYSNLRSKGTLLFFAMLWCASCMQGCAAAQLGADQDQLRQTLLELYTTQVIDNLVRASNGMPIIQMDYTNATTSITMKQTATFGNNYTDTHTNVLAAAVTATHTFTNVVSCTLGLERSNQAAITGTPVTTSNEVYDAYFAFLGVEGSLQCTCEPPPECAAHICRKYGKVYYWVPIEFRRLFMELSLITTSQRGKALLPPSEFFAANIKGIIDPDCKNRLSGDAAAGGSNDVVQVLVELDKEIPNDDGRVVLTVRARDGKDVDVTLAVKAYVPDGVFAPTLTKCVEIAFSAARFHEKNVFVDTPDQLAFPLGAKFYLDHNRPAPDKTAELLDRVNFNLQQIQFNQLRSGGSF